MQLSADPCSALHDLRATIHAPNLTELTRISYENVSYAAGGVQGYWGTIIHESASALTGIEIYATNSTLTGRIQVLGYVQ